MDRKSKPKSSKSSAPDLTPAGLAKYQSKLDRSLQKHMDSIVDTQRRYRHAAYGILSTLSAPPLHEVVIHLILTYAVRYEFVPVGVIIRDWIVPPLSRLPGPEFRLINRSEQKAAANCDDVENDPMNNMGMGMRGMSFAMMNSDLDRLVLEVESHPTRVPPSVPLVPGSAAPQPTRSPALQKSKSGSGGSGGGGSAPDPFSVKMESLTASEFLTVWRAYALKCWRVDLSKPQSGPSWSSPPLKTDTAANTSPPAATGTAASASDEPPASVNGIDCSAMLYCIDEWISELAGSTSVAPASAGGAAVFSRSSRPAFLRKPSGTGTGTDTKSATAVVGTDPGVLCIQFNQSEEPLPPPVPVPGLGQTTGQTAAAEPTPLQPALPAAPAVRSFASLANSKHHIRLYFKSLRF